MREVFYLLQVDIPSRLFILFSLLIVQRKGQRPSLELMRPTTPPIAVISRVIGQWVGRGTSDDPGYRLYNQ
jgi:hypothetical protein